MKNSIKKSAFFILFLIVFLLLSTTIFSETLSNSLSKATAKIGEIKEWIFSAPIKVVFVIAFAIGAIMMMFGAQHKRLLIGVMVSAILYFLAQQGVNWLTSGIGSNN